MEQETPVTKLDFVVIGVQKSATTWIYDCLKNHPEINLRNSKNEEIYYGGKLFQQNGADWYFNQFKKSTPNQVSGCVSVEYIEDKNAPQNLYRLNPDIKIIVSLRNPVKRVISAYQWYVRKVLLPDLDAATGLKEALRHYKGEIKNEYSPMYIDLIQRGFYDGKINSFLNCFPNKNLKIILYEQIKDNSIGALKDIMCFLEVDSEFIPPNVNAMPKKNMDLDLLVKLQRRFPKSKIILRLSDLFIQFVSKKIKNKVVDKKIEDDTINELQKIYRPSVINLKNIVAKADPTLATKIESY